MKFLKRPILTVLLLITFCFLLRGWIYRNLVTYEAAGERTTYTTSPELIKLIEKNANSDDTNSKEIVTHCLTLTSESLKFTDGENEIDPNKLIETKTAHCVGYASFFTTTCNQMFEMNNLSNEWVALPKTGQIYFLGKNVHSYFRSHFFKDHDFVVIKNLKTGEEFGVDPSLHDYTGIRYITLKQ